MLKNYWKTTFRNLWRNKAYGFLNIAGLAIGITCAALIFLWVEREMDWNMSFSKHDRLYHVMQNEKHDAGIFTNGSTPGPLAAALKSDIPGIVNSGRLSWAMDELIVPGDKTVKDNGIYADPSILSMYSLTFVQGDARLAFKQLQSVIISKTLARKLFGSEDAIGKTLKMNARQAYSADGLYTVTGVFADLPSNCAYHFQWVSPYEAWENANTWLKPWSNNLTETIVELSPSADVAAINKKLVHYLSTTPSGATNPCFLFGMNDWHLRAHFSDGVQDGGAIKYVRMFTLIAVAILIIACINFMNLATARSEQRAREVGVLKVLGAGRYGLISKFIGEAILMSFMAVLVAIGLLYAIMPAYNTLVAGQLSVDLFKSSHLLSLIGVVVLCGLTAGSYPAFYLSSFNPIYVLKGIRIRSASSVVAIRRGLVVVQFSTSIILIICTVIIYQQVQYIKNRDIGYNKNNLVYMPLQGNMKDHFATLRDDLRSTGFIENAAVSLHDALHVYSYGDGVGWEGKAPNSKIRIHSNVVSPEYVSTMHFELVGGRDFYPQPGLDSTHVIINESFAKIMGKAGKTGAVLTMNKYRLQVIGIIKDFIYNDVYGSGEPLVLFPGAYAATTLAIRYRQNVDLTQALAKTEAVVKADNPGFPFEYKFADEDFNAFFTAETLIGKLAGLFALLAIVISCLGLFGLAAYMAERRTKEIGIRKVLGASAAALSGLLSREFVGLVMLSCLIAFPVAWWSMHSWLQGYSYRTGIHWWIFPVAGVAALGVALVTVSFQAVRAALGNPAKALRSK